MSQVTLLNFGIAADIIGERQMQIELSDGWTVGDIRHYLSGRYPRLADLASLRFAVNDEYASDETSVNAGDEIVLIPQLAEANDYVPLY